MAKFVSARRLDQFEPNSVQGHHICARFGHNWARDGQIWARLGPNSGSIRQHSGSPRARVSLPRPSLGWGLPDLGTQRPDLRFFRCCPSPSRPVSRFRAHGSTPARTSLSPGFVCGHGTSPVQGQAQYCRAGTFPGLWRTRNHVGRWAKECASVGSEGGGVEGQG